MKKRKLYFRVLKKIARPFFRKINFIYKGEELDKQGIVLSNHVNSVGPMSWELYSNKNIRFWGTYEMNSGLRSSYKYLSEVYFYKKKKWSKFAAKSFSLIAAPFTNLFYKGLNLISTYPDIRFYSTLKETIKVIQGGHNLVIFPEDSENGYFDELKSFFGGFITLTKTLLNKGIRAPIYVAYLNKKKRVCLIDKPLYIDDLLEKYNGDHDAISKALCDRCNELGEETRNTTYPKPKRTKKA